MLEDTLQLRSVMVAWMEVQHAVGGLRLVPIVPNAMVEERERRGQRGADLQDELYPPHISAMASPLPPHVFWHFSLGHTEVLLCFFALPSPQGPIFLPAFLLRWWQ